jgi:nucleotidyltransferase substrate binding protein (TIGR01987 family)
LEEAVSLSAYSKLEQQGLIKGFEITYELAWNTLKDLLQDQGYTSILGSKDTFRLSNQVGLITNGDIWMEMVKSRNATSHTYDESTANEITEAIRENYYFAFSMLISTLEAIITENLRTPDEPSANS